MVAIGINGLAISADTVESLEKAQTGRIKSVERVDKTVVVRFMESWPALVLKDLGLHGERDISLIMLDDVVGEYIDFVECEYTRSSTCMLEMRFKTTYGEFVVVMMATGSTDDHVYPQASLE